MRAQWWPRGRRSNSIEETWIFKRSPRIELLPAHYCNVILWSLCLSNLKYSLINTETMENIWKKGKIWLTLYFSHCNLWCGGRVKEKKEALEAGTGGPKVHHRLRVWLWAYWPLQATVSLQQYDKCLSHKMCRSFLEDRLQRGEINAALGSKVRKAVVGHYFFPEESPDKIQDPLVKFEFHI